MKTNDNSINTTDKIEFTNLYGRRVVFDDSYTFFPQKIKCYLCGNESENVKEFSFCGPKGFAHQDCSNKYK